MLADLIGKQISAQVIDENEHYVFAQTEGLTFRLAKAELKKLPKMGATISGFAYENEEHELQLTKTLPKSGIGRYAWGKVVKVNKSLGVFVDVGLPNKDVVLSLDELPTLTQLWPKVGDELMVALKVDVKGRLWATLATEEMFKQISLRATKKLQNRDVSARVYRLKLVGTYVITTDYQLGFIHPSERVDEPRLGQVLSARVIGVRDDGSLNLSLRPRAYEAISDDAQMILAALSHSLDHSLPFTDKSSPAEIKVYFGISKGQFKRAVGHLMKAGLVKQSEGKLLLNQTEGDIH